MRINFCTPLVLLFFVSVVLNNILAQGNDIDIHKGSNILNPNAPKETYQYGQLVGTWNCTISNLDLKKNKWETRKATWHFKYILNGYAIQDFWINHENAESESQELFGTNIRIYNPSLNIWKCAWMENGKNTLSGIWESYQNEKNELVLEDGTGEWQIVFHHIEKNRFDWKWEYRQIDGSMKTVSKIEAIRAN